MKVEFIKSVYDIKIGEIRDVDDYHGESLISNGICKKYVEVKPKKVK